MGTLTITDAFYSEDDIRDGSIDYDTVHVVENVYEVTAREAADFLIREGLVFYATGFNPWAGSPDGDRIVHYATGQRAETTGYLTGFHPRVEAAIMSVVG